MKRYLALLLPVILTACSSTPPKAPEPTGKRVPVNPPHIQISELSK
ncbi:MULTISPECIES: hypothetical protein [Vibrio]|nr:MULTISPECIES: hypothetical protein [Vibrio]